MLQDRDTFSSYHPLVNFSILWAGAPAHDVSDAPGQSAHFTGQCPVLRDLPERRGGPSGSACGSCCPPCCWQRSSNPAFDHEGATLLAYLPSGNPLTLESIAYGVAAAVMHGAAVVAVVFLLYGGDDLR